MNQVQDRLTEALAGRYTVQREIGRGGMATVYLAHDVKHHRSVAVKVLKAGIAAAVGPDRFLREIEIAAQLSHPHIMPLYDSGYADDALYYVMPFVQGESLHDRLEREKQLSIPDAVRIAREVADALHHAHTNRVIHRDIKPANIMLVSNHAVVSDFGVALLAQAITIDRLTASGVTPGTPVYMSPEQASGAEDIDGRSDIFALGCVLYEMLSGEPPFNGPTPRAILAKKLMGQPTPLRIIRESVGDSLERITFKALSKTAADRFRNAAEFAEALEAVSAEHHRENAAHVTIGPRVATADERALPKASTASGAVASTPLAQLLLIGVAGVLVSTAAGFLATIVYDRILHVPVQDSPSRADFTLIGLRAFIPGLFTAFVILVLYVIAKQLLRMIGVGLNQSKQLKETLHRFRQRSTQNWELLWSRRQPTAVAEVWFTLAIFASAIVLTSFGSTLQAASSTNTDGGIFSCSYRDVHKNFTIAMTVLITTLGISWNRVFRYLSARRASGVSYALARWGGLALICLLALILTAPWRLLWTESPRAMLNSERYYILRETDANLLLYNARSRITERYRIDEVPQLQRLNTSGYIFEDAEAFASPEPGC